MLRFSLRINAREIISEEFDPRAGVSPMVVRNRVAAKALALFSASDNAGSGSRITLFEIHDGAVKCLFDRTARKVKRSFR